METGADPRERGGEGGLLKRGGAKRLTVYLNEAARWGSQPLHEAVLELLARRGLAGGTLLRASAGFTRGAGIVTTSVLRLAERLPVKVEVVDAEEAIERVLPDVYAMVEHGLITVDDVTVIKHAAGARARAPEPGGDAALRPREVTMKAKQLVIYISSEDTFGDEPLYEAIVKRFNQEEFAGLTVQRAIEGFGAHRRVHRRGYLTHSDAPLVLIMVDSEANVERARELLGGMLKRGATVVSDVEVTYYGTSCEGREA